MSTPAFLGLVLLAAADPTRATGDWHGTRTDLEERGLTFEGYMTADWSAVVTGESRARFVSRALLEAATTLDAEKAGGAPGLTLGLRLQAFVGQPGTPLTQDVQVFDNIDADPFVGLAEAWIHQTWGRKDRFSLWVGRMDANTHFATVEADPVAVRVRARRQFIHSSMGFSPTMPRFASYPAQALGAVFTAAPGESVRLAGGVFDGAIRPSFASTIDPPVDAPAFSSVFAVGEGGVGWQLRRRNGHFTLGGFVLAGREVKSHVAAGFYSVLTQTLWEERSDGDQGLGLFGQYAHTPSRESEVVHHGGGGLSWTGAFPRRDADALGMGASWVGIRDRGGLAHETALEVFYRFAVEPYLWVQPDVQAIFNPAGRHQDALVFTLRLSVDA